MKIKLRCVKPCSIIPSYCAEPFYFELGKEYYADFSKGGIKFLIGDTYSFHFDPNEFCDCFVSGDDTENDVWYGCVYVLQRISTSPNFPPYERVEETLFFQNRKSRDEEYEKQKGKFDGGFHRWILTTRELLK